MHPSRRDTLAGAAALTVAAPRALVVDATARALSNSVASAEAKALYAYLWSIYGRYTLTGQQECPEVPRTELPYLERVTGRQPAILGLDFIDPKQWPGVLDRATDWHRAGGIVTLCWHWGAPDIGTGYENAKKDFDVAKALTPGTSENRLMTVQMAEVAGQLATLRDRHVPVLWRPFHEFSGDWFWWGKHGPDAFKALWRFMYEYFTRTRGLNNLLWVLGWAGQNIDRAYDPGRAYVDIAGADLYVDDHGNLADLFAQVQDIVGGTVPICLHENGPIPDPSTLGPRADWLWFMTWHTRWLEDPSQNDPGRLRDYYASNRYLTRDEVKSHLSL